MVGELQEAGVCCIMAGGLAGRVNRWYSRLGNRKVGQNRDITDNMKTSEAIRELEELREKRTQEETEKRETWRSYFLRRALCPEVLCVSSSGAQAGGVLAPDQVAPKACRTPIGSRLTSAEQTTYTRV